MRGSIAQALLLLMVGARAVTEPAPPFEVLSPHPGQVLVASYFFASVQFNHAVFELGKHGYLQVRLRYGDITQEVRFDSMQQSSLALTDGVFSFALHIAGEDALTALDIELSAISDDGTAEYTARRQVRCVAPFGGRRGLNTAALGPPRAAPITIADSTLITHAEPDGLRMHLTEHRADVVILDDTNTYFSGDPRPFVLTPAGPGGRQTVYAVDRADLVSSLGVEGLHGPAAALTFPRLPHHLFVNRRDSRGENQCGTDKEAQFRDSIADAARWLSRQPSVCTSGHQREGVGQDTCDFPLPTSPDLFIICDADEVLRADTLKLLRESSYIRTTSEPSDTQRETVVLFSLSHHIMKFNWRMKEPFGLNGNEFAFVAPASLVRSLVSCPAEGSEPMTATKVRRLVRTRHTETFVEITRRYNLVVWNDAGWHLSSFRNASAESVIRHNFEYLYRTNSTFWTEERCQLLQEVGVPHYLVSGGGAADDIIARLPDFVASDSFCTPNDDKNPSELPEIACLDTELFDKYSIEHEVTSDIRKEKLLELLVTQERKNRIIYHASSGAGSWFEFTCSPALEADPDEVLAKLFCDGCPYLRSEDAEALALRHVQSTCRNMRTSTIRLQVLGSS